MREEGPDPRPGEPPEVEEPDDASVVTGGPLTPAPVLPAWTTRVGEPDAVAWPGEPLG